MSQERLSSQTRQTRTALIVASTTLLTYSSFFSELPENIIITPLGLGLPPIYLFLPLVLSVYYFGISFAFGFMQDFDEPRVGHLVSELKAVLEMHYEKTSKVVNDGDVVIPYTDPLIIDEALEVNRKKIIKKLIGNINTDNTGAAGADVKNALLELADPNFGLQMRRRKEWIHYLLDSIKSFNLGYDDFLVRLRPIEGRITLTNSFKDRILDAGFPLSYGLISLLIGIIPNPHSSEAINVYWAKFF